MTASTTATRGLFITGTDTGVGKTYVTALIARELTTAGSLVGVYKPCCTGSTIGRDQQPIWDDVTRLSAAVDDRFEEPRICPQRFHAPLCPPAAARSEGRRVDAALLRSGARWWNERVRMLLVEGVGGLLCPLTETETVADLACDLGYPLIVVARLGLGTINHTLLTLEAAARRGLCVAGIVLNEAGSDATDRSTDSNPHQIAARTDVPVLGVVTHNQPVGLLRDGGRIRIDWASLAAGSPQPTESLGSPDTSEHVC